MYIKEVTLGEAQHFYQSTLKCLQEGSPIKTPLAKTLTALEPLIVTEGDSLRDQLMEITEGFDSESKTPIYKEGKTLEDYEKVIESSKDKTISFEVYTVKANESYIMPNGFKIKIEDYLEKATHIPAATALFLIDNFIENPKN